MNVQPGNRPFKYVYFLPLHPRVLKNSRMIVTVKSKKTRSGFRGMSLPSKAASSFMEKGAEHIRAVKGPSSPLDCPVSLRMVFHGPWGTGDKLPDLSNLYQAVEDLLEECGVLANDSLVSSHDGSRRVPLCDHCPDRPVIKAGPRKGMRKESCGAKSRCPHVGVLAEITPFEGLAEEESLALARFRKAGPTLAL